MPFAIPEKWKWVSASYVQTLVRGVTFPASAKAKTQTSNSICCLTTGSVQEKYANKADVFVDQSFMKNTRQILQVGDVVISSANSKELVGKSILWEDNSGIQKTFGGFLTVARVKDSQTMIPEYLFLVYRYMFKIGYFANLSAQTTNIANLSNKLLDSLVFPIAPLAEQKRIATQINQLFEQIDCAEKAYNELSGPLSERFRQLCLEKAIQGKLVPQLESEPEVTQIGEAPEDVPFAIPEKWKWISASYVQTLVRGITFPASAKTKMQTHKSICCLTTGSVQEKYASKADVFVDQSFMKNTRQILQVGDVVISSANSKELVGKSILWEDNSGIQKTFGGFLTVARVKDSQTMIPEYLFLVYRYMFKTGYFANLSTQTTNIANLSYKLLDSLVFPIPPLEEQHRIAAKLNELLGAVVQLENTISAT